MKESTHNDPTAFWDDLYAGSEPVWSGRPNQAVAEMTADLAPGRALDVGCGEGGDAVWLARNGWLVTGIDISATAIERARAAAAAAGLSPSQCNLRVQDLALGFPEDEDLYDLVTASFFQSPVELPRAQVLRSAADLIAPGGHLLLVSHAGPPTWAPVPDAHGGEGAEHRSHHFISPADEVAGLALDPASWMMVLAQARPRQVTSPTGELGEIDDAVVMFRRKPME